MGSNGWLIKGDSCIELKGTEIGERKLKGAAAELMFKLGLRTLKTLVTMKQRTVGGNEQLMQSERGMEVKILSTSYQINLKTDKDEQNQDIQYLTSSEITGLESSSWRLILLSKALMEEADIT